MSNTNLDITTLAKLSNKALRDLAASNGVDLGSLNKKADILAKLASWYADAETETATEETKQADAPATETAPAVDDALATALADAMIVKDADIPAPTSETAPATEENKVKDKPKEKAKAKLLAATSTRPDYTLPSVEEVSRMDAMARLNALLDVAEYLSFGESMVGALESAIQRTVEKHYGLTFVIGVPVPNNLIPWFKAHRPLKSLKDTAMAEEALMEALVAKAVKDMDLPPPTLAYVAEIRAEQARLQAEKAKAAATETDKTVTAPEQVVE